MPRAWIRRPQRRSIVSSSPRITGPRAAKTSMRRPSRIRLPARGHHAARLRMRWAFTNRRSCARPMMRRMLDTVRRPGVRIAPISRSCACRHERWTNSGANVRINPAKRAGRGSMAVSLGGDTISLTVMPASSPHPFRQPGRWAKVELRPDPLVPKCCEASSRERSGSDPTGRAPSLEGAAACRRLRIGGRRCVRRTPGQSSCIPVRESPPAESARSRKRVFGSRNLLLSA